MQTIPPAEIRKGMALMVDGAPHMTEDLHTSGTARTRHKIHARLRNLLTGRHVDRVFTDNERVTVPDMETRHVEFSYKQGEAFVFLDAETFDELTVTAEQIGTRRFFLKEEEQYRALLLEGRLMDIVFPDYAVMKVLETGAPQHGVGDATWKPAKLENDLEILVPPFIATGDSIRVDTRERKYVKKESAE